MGKEAGESLGERPGDEHAENNVGGSDKAPGPTGHAEKDGFGFGVALLAEQQAIDGQGAGGQSHLQDAEQDVGKGAEEAEKEDELGDDGHGGLGILTGSKPRSQNRDLGRPHL